MFSLILPSRPCLTTSSPLPSSPNGNQFAFSFPLLPRFSHVVVFLNPGVVLPEGTAAGVYFKLPEGLRQTGGGGDEGGFRFLGALANEKQSAIFKVNLPGGGGELDAMGIDGGGGVAGREEVTVGISVEPIANIQAQLLQLQHSQPQSPSHLHSHAQSQEQQPPSTKVLAQRIIKNAFNFLAGFSGRVGDGGIEVVPLKSFEEWWRKFERRVEVDPGFLERGDEG